MSNLGYVKTRRKMTAAQIHESLIDINNRRFKGYFVLKPETCAADTDYWDVDLKDEIQALGGGLYGFSVCLVTPRQLSFKPAGMGWTYWAYRIFVHELARIYGGRISDESDPKVSSPPDDSKFKTYRDWCIFMHKHVKDPAIRAFLLKEDLRATPKKLRF